jgi:hypothetical protein
MFQVITRLVGVGSVGGVVPSGNSGDDVGVDLDLKFGGKMGKPGSHSLR